MTILAHKTLIILYAVLTLTRAGSGVVAQAPDTTTRAPEQALTASVRPLEEFRMVPVRVHLLRDSETPAAITKLTEEDVARIFKKANGIWQTAGVHLWVESIVSEKPASTVGFEHSQSLPDQALLPLRPAGTLEQGMFHVYYIGAMAPNGIFMRRDAIFVKETAQLRPVAGGIDEPLPRVTAHELGHGMGLPHRQDTFNLMASGTTGTSLSEVEIAIVRQRLDRLPWVLTPALFLKHSDELSSAGNRAQAHSQYRAILELPGESPLKSLAQAKLSKE